MDSISFAGRARARFAARSARVFPVLRCRGRARTLVGPTRRWLVEPPSQALKNATSSAFFTHAISAPLAPLMRARGKPEKPYSRRESSTGSRSGAVLGSLCFSAVAGGFQGISPRHQRGMRRRPGNERLPKAALLSACEANGDLAQRSEAERSQCPFREVRARPGRRSTLKTAGGRPQAAVDPRRELLMIMVFLLVKKRQKSNVVDA